MSVTESERRVAKQRGRVLHTKIQILNYDFREFDSIEGVVLDGANFTCDANSDIRRTCSLSFIPTIPKRGVGYGKDIWLDKYVKIFIGIEDESNNNEIVWTNMGIYLINNPEQVYDAVQNVITISGLDMMAKITGLRNGNLIFGEQGELQPATSYFVDRGTGIKQVMTTVLNDCGWSGALVDISQPTPTILTPMDMTFNLGATAYNIVSQLRDINSGYETYFDTDGIFHFRQIPYSLYAPWTAGNISPITGQFIYKSYNKGDRCSYTLPSGFSYIYESLVDNNTNVKPNTTAGYWRQVSHTYDEIFADDTLWDKVLIAYNRTYDFESVKNYIEVFGKTQNDGNTPYGLAYDNNPNSPFYYAGTVGTINIVLNGGEYDNIYPILDWDDTEDDRNHTQFNSLAQQRAEWELFQRCRLQDTVNLTIVPVYWLDVNKLVTITLPNEDDGSVVTEQYVIKSINTTLGVDSVQEVTLMKYYPLYE